MSKYDGWVVKSVHGWFLNWTFGERKSGIINCWGREWWRKSRRKGEYKLVKVKLVEVE